MLLKTRSRSHFDGKFMKNHDCAEHSDGNSCGASHVSTSLPVIDLHCHIATPAVEKLVTGHPARLAEMQSSSELQGTASTEYNRAVMLPACIAKMTNLETRIADMDEMQVDIQVLSPSPGQYYYWAEEDLAKQIVTLQNEHIAETVAAHPDRFAGLAAVALQHPELAAAQLEHAVTKLGMRGVEISTSAGGRELADPALDVFWAKAQDLGAVVFIHPLGSSLGARLNKSYLANIIGQPIETTIALSHLIFGGVLDRNPTLKIVAAHGGGYLPTYSSRSDHAWHARPDSHTMAEPLSNYLRRIHFDSLVYTPDALKALIDQVGSSQIVVGTDYPFDMGSYDVLELIAAVEGLSDAERVAILSGNAAALLGLELINRTQGPAMSP
jgi:aminocarboxymuconate-semialdehyde decarboxylase